MRSPELAECLAELARECLDEASGWPAGAGLWLCEAAYPPRLVSGPMAAQLGPGAPEAHIEPGIWIRAAMPPGTEALGQLLLRPLAALVRERRERQNLQSALHGSYDAFRALRSMVSDRSLLLQPAQAIATLVAEAAAQEPGLCAALWLERDDQMLAAEVRGCEAPPMRSASCGAVGEVLIKGIPIVENRWSASAWRTEEEPELLEASRVLAVPLEVRNQVTGALVVWHREPGAFDDHDLHVHMALAAQAGLLLDHNRLHVRAVEATRLEEDLRVAAQIQERLLVGKLPSCPRGVNIASTMLPSLGGDFVDWFRHPDGSLDLLVGDVMGSGLPATMVAAGLKSRFQRQAPAEGRDPEIEPPSPRRIVTGVHESLTADLEDLECFATAVYLRVDAQHRHVSFVDCGHPPILHYSSSMERVVSWRKEWKGLVNLPLGMSKETRFEQVEVDLEEGDLMLIYTDGVTEPGPKDVGAFDEDELSKLLCEHHDEDVHEVLRLINETLMRRAYRSKDRDDATLILLKFQAQPEEALVLELEASLDQLKDAREFVTDVAGQTPLRGDSSGEDALRLALEEHLTNIIRHGYGPGGEGRIEVRARALPRGAEITVTDAAPPFDPTEEAELPQDLLAPSGRGLWLMQELCSELRYERTADGRNRLVMVRTKDACPAVPEGERGEGEG